MANEKKNKKERKGKSREAASTIPRIQGPSVGAHLREEDCVPPQLEEDKVDVEKLAKGRYLALTTFRRDGTPVSTPVWVARQGDELVVYTARSSGKVKRLRNNNRVLLAPCDMRGRVTGDVVEATARLQDDAESAISLIRREYGLQARLLFWWNARHVGDGWVGRQVGIAIRLDGS